MVVNVVVIGAGISGLVCARELSKYSDAINLTVLEASDRIGGRINSITTDDGTVLELGAHYIHGTEKNPIYELAVEKGIIKATEVENPSKVVECFHKSIVSSCSNEKMCEAIPVATSLATEIETKLRSLDIKEINRHKTVGNYLMENFRAKLHEVSHDKELCNVLKSVLCYLVTYRNFYSGCNSPFDLDLRGNIGYKELDGDLYYAISDHCAGGYGDIIDSIVEDIKVNCIRKNCEVDKIENVVLGGQSKIKVHCSNENIFIADTVIVTVSVAVLKHFTEIGVFSPQLTEQKLSSLDKIVLGKVLKIYFKFLTPPENDVTAFEFYPSPELFETPLLKPQDNLLLFERVKASDWWLHWMQCDDRMDLKNFNFAEYLDGLVSSCSENYPRFPSLQVDLKTIITFDWVSNKFYRGSYSYIGKYSDRSIPKILAEPITYEKANLLFAGEATSEKYYSTAHGAYLSGAREADNVKRIYNLC